jgi:hypothetical protein
MRFAWLLIASLFTLHVWTDTVPATARAVNGTAQTSDPIVGSWSIRVEQPDRPPGAVLGSFMSDGVYLQSDEPGASSAHGLWRRESGDIYQVKFELFTLAGDDPAALLRLQVRGQVRIDSTGNGLMGTYEADAVTPEGEVRETTTGMVRAVRMTL